MTWHLKNRELEKSLNENNHPMHTFTDDLNRRATRAFSDDWPFPIPTSLIVEFQRLDKNGVILTNNSLEFSIDELEHIPAYNTVGWNHWPETRPEECVLMEIRKDGDNESHDFLFFLDGIWYHAMGCSCITLSDEKFRYRPAKLFFEEQRISERR